MNPHIQFMDPSGKVLLEKNLESFPQKIGRAPENEISIPHPSISRFHCRIELRNGKIWLVDLDSVNGIRVQNERVKEMPLVGSLDFKLGEIRVLFRGSLAGAIETMEATRIVGNGAPVKPASGGGPASAIASSEEKTSRFTLSNASTSGSSTSGLSLKNSIPQLPGSEDATVVRRPVKPVSVSGVLPELKKPGTGFEDSTQTSFKLRSEASSKNSRVGMGKGLQPSTSAGDLADSASDVESASAFAALRQALRAAFSGISWGQRTGSRGRSLAWFKSSGTVGAWIGAGLLFAFALSWWSRNPRPTIPSAKPSISKPAVMETIGETPLPRRSRDSSNFWSRSEAQSESLEKFLERVSPVFLDSRTAENEP